MNPTFPDLVRSRRSIRSFSGEPIPEDVLGAILDLAAFDLSSREKADQENESLRSVRDSFKKVIVVKDDIKIRRDDSGTAVIGLWNFLLDPDSLYR